METMLENRYVARFPAMVEYYRKYGSGPRLPTVIACAVFLAVLTIFCAANGILEQMLTKLLLFAAAGTALFFLPYLVAWNALRHTQKQNDGVIPETVITFGDTIELHEGMVHITVEYRKICKVVRLKHSYMLMIGKRNGVMLQPDCFTKGTFEQFKEFLRETRPDLTIPE